MNIELKELAIKVKHKIRNDEERKEVSVLLYEDMPLIMKDEYNNRFMKKPYNEGKDCVDFYFIKLSQTNKFFKTGKEPVHDRPVERKEPEYKQPEMNDTVKLGDLIMTKKSH